jgi:hypothetical protein
MGDQPAFGGINMNTLIHVGVELVIIGGVTFYLHKKISSVQEENEELKRVIVEHEERIKRCEEFIQGMANMMNGGPPLRTFLHKLNVDRVELL